MAARGTAVDVPLALREAAEWFAVLQDEPVSDADRRRWREWVDADPAHARVWAQVQAIGQPFARAAEAAPPQALRDTLAHARAPGRRRALRLLGLGGMAVGAGLLARRTLPWQAWWHAHALAHADHRTPIGEQRRLTLPDGTRLHLNTATAVDLDFGRALRRIVLIEGEILVDSAPDDRMPSRALVVDSAGARLTALGTRFAVRGDARSGRVAVFEGAVRVTARNGASVDVPAGHQARFTADRAEPDGPADPARERWAHGQLVADDLPLEAFVAELSRYTAVPITLAPAAARLRLVGVYPIDRPGRDVPMILAALERVLPVRVQRTPAGGLYIEAR